MIALVYFLVICALIYFIITWFIPKVIGYLLVRKFKIKISFGYTFPFSLVDVKISKNGFSVQIDEICIRSSCFNSVTKLLSINIRDIRINKDINKKLPTNAAQFDGQDFFSSADGTDDEAEKIIDFRNKKVPPFIITFAQFMAVHVHNISIVLMNNNFEPSWVLHATAGELHLDGSIVQNAKTLLVSAALSDAQAKILRHFPPKNQTIHEKTNQNRPCLVELSFGIALDSTLIAQGPISVEKLTLSMNNTKTTLHGGLYDFIKDAKYGKYMSRLHNTASAAGSYGAGNDSLKMDTYHRLSPIMPKQFSVNIEDTTISAVRENSSNDFCAKLQQFMINGKFSFNTIEEDYQFPMLYTGLQLQQLEIETMHEKLLFIEQFSIDSKLEKDVLNIYAKLKSFQLIYNHSEIFNWIDKNFFTTNHTSSVLVLNPTQSNPYAHIARSNLLESLLKKIILQGCAELWNVSTIFKIAEQVSSISVSHTKLRLEQFAEVRSSVYDQRLLNLLLGQRHWSTELMIESVWWSLGNATRDSSNLKKQHVRGSPIYLGVSLMKLSSYGDATKLDFSVHTLRTEYSNYFAEFIVQSVNSVKQYRSNGGDHRQATRRTLDLKSSGNLLIEAQIQDVTCFFFNKFENCILWNLKSLALTRTQNLNFILKLDTFQMAIADISGVLKNIFANFKMIRLEFYPKIGAVPQLNLYLLEDTEAMWNSNLHMHIVTLVQGMQEFWAMAKPSGDNTADPSKPLATKPKLMFDLFAEGNTEFGIKISERHSMQIFLENVYVNRKERILISVENVFINIDGMHMFTFKDLDIQSMRELSILRAERKNYENFVLPSNRVWATTIGGVKGIFPYDHDFSEAIHNEFVSLFKWLKIVHNYKKKAFTQDSPLPSDMIIQIKEFLIEMSDDPFEVKLRDNYVLLLDEYNESLKRKQLFDERIAELIAERLLLPAGTVEDLNASLIKKTSEIYIQRSKKIAETGPPRTRLLAWVMNDLEIMAMADPSIHGTENVVHMIQEIDSESPWPEEGLEFVTLWCRAINVSCTEWKFMLRDYPQPMFHVKGMHLFGNLCGAEQMAQRRAKRDVQIEIGDPFGTEVIQRGMTALKFYHDFDWELEHLVYAFGPCWEPVMAQCNLSFEKISTPSRDPSPPLPFWDKLRLLYHGRLTVLAKQFTILLHASLDPYNTTEEMELTWNNCGIVWTNAKIMFKGELNVSVRTASRYDDCRLLHLPNLKLTFKLTWNCLANPNDHHAVIPCAPDKLPEYSSNQVHDSFRAFRSQNVYISISFETRPSKEADSIPTLVLYGSTLRWFESLKLILSGVTRPTRRGPVFNNIRPRKKQLSRHYRGAHLQMSLHKFTVLYWMSHTQHRGFQLNGDRVSYSSEHTLTLHPIDDGLIHRPRADWAIIYMNCELNDAEIWLRTTTLNEKSDTNSDNISNSNAGDICRDYFLSVAKVSYGRDGMLMKNGQPQKDAPTHILVVYDLKGAWTKNNRDVAFALFDSFMKSQRLKDNLSTEALARTYRKDNSTPSKSKKNDGGNSAGSQILSPGASTSSSHVPINKHQQTPHGIAMLQQLIAESDHKLVVFSDDLSTQTREQQLKGLQACQDDDVIYDNWRISLVNSQVLLKGCETSGYVILSAAKAEILQRVHRPVWRDRTIVSKTTWVGSLECMQYYATVSAEDSDPREMAEIMWLTVDNIQEKDKDATVINEFPDIPHLVGSGQSVGGVVSECVGATPAHGHPGEKYPVQLQRIVSRCKCEFFYVSYGDTSIDPGTVTEVPPPPTEETMSPWEKQDEPVDAFTLMHHDLDVCTNSLQYAMILDIVNNLLLYVDSQRKQALEKLARMRFQLQLYSSEDQKRPIQHLQTQIRSLMSRIRSLEKDIHFIGRARIEEGDDNDLREEYEEVQKHIRECKEMLTIQSDELDMMLSCYKETQLSASNKLATIRQDKPLTIVRANEICFKHAQWRLTEADGQIGIADLILSNFLYTKNSRSDDSVEHLLELGYIRINNLIPRDSYQEVLCPTEIQKDMPVDHKRVIRVFCREKPPVGGISVKEHFEINVVPITIAISKKFYSTMLKFCFPDRDPAEAEGNDDIDDSSGSTSSLKSSTNASTSSAAASGQSGRVRAKNKKGSKDSNFYVKIEKDDVEKMKERAEKNKLFIYIKIPEVPVRVSYKGNKEKNLEDINDLSLLIPTLEYHNVTWTWLDLLLAMKSDSRRVLLSQAIKQKLKIRSPLYLTDEKPSPQEEDKAKMLFGNRHAPENKSQRKGVFKFPKS